MPASFQRYSCCENPGRENYSQKVHLDLTVARLFQWISGCLDIARFRMGDHITIIGVIIQLKPIRLDRKMQVLEMEIFCDPNDLKAVFFTLPIDTPQIFPTLFPRYQIPVAGWLFHSGSFLNWYQQEMLSKIICPLRFLYRGFVKSCHLPIHKNPFRLINRCAFFVQGHVAWVRNSRIVKRRSDGNDCRGFLLISVFNEVIEFLRHRTPRSGRTIC